MELKIKRLEEKAKLPLFAHSHDAGMDLYSIEDVVFAPGVRAVVRTGIALAIPTGYVGLIWDKSGIATKGGITTMGGVIDAGYRGEIGVLLYNAGDEEYTITAGQKVAQLLIQPVEQPKLVEVDDLDATSRGEGGFGSTGLE